MNPDIIQFIDDNKGIVVLSGSMAICKYAEILNIEHKIKPNDIDLIYYIKYKTQPIIIKNIGSYVYKYDTIERIAELQNPNNQQLDIFFKQIKNNVNYYIINNVPIVDPSLLLRDYKNNSENNMNYLHKIDILSNIILKLNNLNDFKQKTLLYEKDNNYCDDNVKGRVLLFY